MAIQEYIYLIDQLGSDLHVSIYVVREGVPANLYKPNPDVQPPLRFPAGVED